MIAYRFIPVYFIKHDEIVIAHQIKVAIAA